MSSQMHQSSTLAHNVSACIKCMICCTFSSRYSLSNIVSTLLEKLSMQVLKLQPQDQVKVGIVNGPFGQATVLHTHPDVVLQCHLWQTLPAPGQLYLVLAMPRPKVCNMITPGIIAISTVILAWSQLPTWLYVYKHHKNHKVTLLNSGDEKTVVHSCLPWCHASSHHRRRKGREGVFLLPCPQT